MSLSAEAKAEVVEKHRIHDRDTGSAAVQIALITTRLNQLQSHFEAHKKDHHSRRGLLKLVGKRRSLLDYIRSRDVQAYRSLIQELGIRK